MNKEARHYRSRNAKCIHRLTLEAHRMIHEMSIGLAQPQGCLPRNFSFWLGHRLTPVAVFHRALSSSWTGSHHKGSLTLGTFDGPPGITRHLNLLALYGPELLYCPE